MLCEYKHILVRDLAKAAGITPAQAKLAFDAFTELSRPIPGQKHVVHYLTKYSSQMIRKQSESNLIRWIGKSHKQSGAARRKRVSKRSIIAALSSQVGVKLNAQQLNELSSIAASYKRAPIRGGPSKRFRTKPGYRAVKCFRKMRG
ncbi:MAG: hypothetical protein PHW60_03680 [Kiritimatiellae bacterium]|nr:hypothetical protein [Kiritimatiellia bacterium]